MNASCEAKATCLECAGEGCIEHPHMQAAYGGSHAECPSDPPLIDCEHCSGEGECDCDECTSAASEAAYERRCEDFYGGSRPVTLDEQHRAAWHQKQDLRK